MKLFVLLPVLFALVCLPHFVNVKSFTTPLPFRAGQAGERAKVRASGRGYPHITLSDGFALPAAQEETAKSRSSFEKSSAATRSIAAADFDEDGTPDLVCGYLGADGEGMLTIYTGNEDSIYPNSPDAQRRKASGAFTDAAFLSPARAYRAIEPVDFLGAGDFDADGHADVVMAARTSATLYLLAGDGRGNLELARRIDLPGRVTALAVGEVNRADGLADLAVGIAGSGGAEALVFESPSGALRANPETFSLPAEASALAFGRLDGDYLMDLAVGAGSNLLIARGRNRRLSLDPSRQAEVPDAALDNRLYTFNITSIAVGDFTGDAEPDLGLLSSDGTIYFVNAERLQQPSRKMSRGDSSNALRVASRSGATGLIRARVSTGPADDLLVTDVAKKQVHILTADDGDSIGAMREAASLDVEDGPVAVLPMRLNADALSDLVVLYDGGSTPVVVKTAAASVFTVTTKDGINDGVCDGDCTFFDALSEANDNPGADLINFNIPGPGPHIIEGTARFEASDPVTIDATSQPGYAGFPLIWIGDQILIDISIALTVTAGNSSVRGFLTSGYDFGMRLSTRPGNIVEANYLGVGGPDFAGNRFDGLDVRSSNNIIGGTSPKARNVISGNRRIGIRISSVAGNRIKGNYIGTNGEGTAALGNRDSGVAIFGGSNNVIGGTEPGAGNLISGNLKGVDILGIVGSGNLIQGNFIGTDLTGKLSLGNDRLGVSLSSPGNTVGGTTERARNIVSGNGGPGIALFFGQENLVQGNFIGTDVDAVARVPNVDEGVIIEEAPNNTIGGGVEGARNIISGNGSSGVFIAGPNATANRIQGNFIGTDVTGSLRLFNGGSGVELFRAMDTLIGGLSVEARNVISGNLGSGIFLGAKRTIVQGNFIGTDRAGLQELGNLSGGVSICCGRSDSEVTENLIGGTTVEARNIISGNGGAGVGISGVLPRVFRNTVQGNFIGTDVTGTAAIANRAGVGITESDDNIIGGTESGAGNLISGNQGTAGVQGNGIFITGFAARNLIQGNFIGTDLTGSRALGNSKSGVLIDEGFDNTIGGTVAAARNVIAFNGSQGVFLDAGVAFFNNAIRRNSIFSNAALGIDLSNSFNSPDGVTPNDQCDGDEGANGLQNYPALLSAVRSGSATTIQGALNSAPDKTFTLEFSSNTECDGSGFGEGKTFIGSTTVTTDSNCNAAFSASLPVAVAAGQFITATATDPAGNTSEFSQCVQVAVAFDLCLQGDNDGNLLLVNTTTGEYQFNSCTGITVSGTATISIRGCSILLQHNAPDRRLLARIDACARTGTASLQLLSQGVRLSITDRDFSNNTCSCAGGQMPASNLTPRRTEVVLRSKRHYYVFSVLSS